MIKRETVFVLGAGASKPYGFLTGRDLKANVLTNMTWGGGPWRGYLSELQFARDEVTAFNREFGESGRPSVDLFVEHRPDYLRLGKAAIALALIPCERPDTVFPSPDHVQPYFRDDNWYQYIFEKMDAPFDQFCENQVSFVTFNYDRSLEHFFRTALKNLYGKSLADADAVLEEIPIVHVHGRLGALDAAGRYFGPDLSTQDVRIAMDDIVIMSYADKSSRAFQKAREELGSAKRIYFLGFGYNTSNMTRLEVRAYDGKIGGGTSRGLGLAERQHIDVNWHVPLFASNPQAQDLNTLAFLKDFASLA